MAYRAMVNSLSPSKGETVRVRCGSKILSAVIPRIGAAFSLTPALSPDFGGEGELNHLSMLPAALCSSQRTS